MQPSVAPNETDFQQWTMVNTPHAFKEGRTKVLRCLQMLKNPK